MVFLTKASVRFSTVVLIMGVLFIPVTIPYRVIILAGAALLWTFLETRTLQTIGLSRRPLRSILLWAISIAVGVIVFGQLIEPMINWLLGVHSDLSGYGALKGNTRIALKLLGFSLVSAAIGEEILFRGFLLHQLTSIFGSSNRARLCSILISSTLFGLAHSVQGLVGVISTGLVGAIFSWAWFRSGRNLWALMLAHALVDSFGIGMLYLGFS